MGEWEDASLEGKKDPSKPNRTPSQQRNKHTDTTICGSSPLLRSISLPILRHQSRYPFCMSRSRPSKEKKVPGTDLSKGFILVCFCPELSSRSAITPENDIMLFYHRLHIILGYQSSSNPAHLVMYLFLPSRST